MKTKSGISSLLVDSESMSAVHDLQLGELCPQVKELTLEFHRAMKLDIITMASSTFQNLSKLCLVGPREYWISLDQPSSFCKHLMTSFPQITSLTFTDIRLGNKTTLDVIRHIAPHKCLSVLQ